MSDVALRTFVDALRGVLRLQPLYSTPQHEPAIYQFEGYGRHTPKQFVQQSDMTQISLSEINGGPANAARPRLNRNGGRL